MRHALDAGVVAESSSIFDYGCGRGDDVRHLRGLGFTCCGWDPVHVPDETRESADIVNLGYVVNVIEDSWERSETLNAAWDLATRLLVVSARLPHEAEPMDLKPFRDGFLTKRGTFQKFFTQHELRAWIDTTLGVESVAAAPGIFFVFRDHDLREHFEASRFRRRAAAPTQRISDALYEQHHDILQPLMEFVAQRGRVPRDGELDDHAL